MIAIIVFLLLIAAAAQTDSIRDTLQYHFSNSVFSRMRRSARFWDPEISWYLADRMFFFKMKLDARHVAKILTLSFGVAAMMVYRIHLSDGLITWWADVMIIAADWNLSFNLGKNKLYVINKPNTDHL